MSGNCSTAGLKSLVFLLGIFALTATASWEYAVSGGDEPRTLRDAPAPLAPRPIQQVDNNAADGVRETINRLLPKASAEEREIWFQQFKNFPPGVVEDMLQFRQEMIGQGGPLLPQGTELSPQQLPQSPSDNRLPSPPPPATLTPQLARTFSALQLLKTVTLQNILHARTPGYRSLEVHLAPQGAPDTEEGALLQLAALPPRLNLRQAKAISTSRPLDIALEGSSGWLAATVPKGVSYTRFGGLEINARQQLSVRLAGGVYPLVPEIKIPAEAAQITIEKSGEVQCVLPGKPGSTVAGTILLTTFRDPTQLVYDQHGGFMAPPAALPANLLPPVTDGSGPFLSGYLEASNVDVAHERATLSWIAEMEQQLQTLVPPSDRLSAVPGGLLDEPAPLPGHRPEGDALNDY